MTCKHPAHLAASRTRSTIVAAVAVVSAALVGVLVHQSPASASLSAVSLVDLLRGDHDRALGEAHGAVPDGVTVFDDDIPALAKLDPGLLGALRHAAVDAEADGVQLFVNSGWRSPEYQAQLLEDAVSKYGSRQEAARWVATPDTSRHVSGDAVDIGPASAAAWLAEHGAAYGLCQIYANEPWHYELRPEAIERGCPPLYADPAQDPRLRQ